MFPVGLSSAGRHLALPVSLWGQQLPVLDEAFSYSPSPWTLGCSSEGQGRSSDRFGDLSSCLPLGYSASTQNLGWLSGWVLCCWWPCTVGSLPLQCHCPQGSSVPGRFSFSMLQPHGVLQLWETSCFPGKPVPQPPAFLLQGKCSSVPALLRLVVFFIYLFIFCCVIFPVIATAEFCCFLVLLFCSKRISNPLEGNMICHGRRSELVRK